MPSKPTAQASVPLHSLNTSAHDFLAINSDPRLTTTPQNNSTDSNNPPKRRQRTPARPPELYKCEFCKKEYLRKEARDFQVLRHHSCRCRDCGQDCKNKCQLAVHGLETHNGCMPSQGSALWAALIMTMVIGLVRRVVLAMAGMMMIPLCFGETMHTSWREREGRRRKRR